MLEFAAKGHAKANKTDVCPVQAIINIPWLQTPLILTKETQIYISTAQPKSRVGDSTPGSRKARTAISSYIRHKQTQARHNAYRCGFTT